MARDFIEILGSVRTRAFKATASDVKGVRHRSATDSSTRATVLTPTSGKKVRIISVQASTTSTAIHIIEMYFDTGANITTNAGKEIAYTVVDADGAQGDFTMVWPDSGGPVGAADEVLSYRSSTDITTGDFLLVHYREE